MQTSADLSTQAVGRPAAAGEESAAAPGAAAGTGSGAADAAGGVAEGGCEAEEPPQARGAARTTATRSGARKDDDDGTTAKTTREPREMAEAAEEIAPGPRAGQGRSPSPATGATYFVVPAAAGAATTAGVALLLLPLPSAVPPLDELVPTLVVAPSASAAGRTPTTFAFWRVPIV